MVRSLPSLTIQYIADTASIELSRDCRAEGIKRLICNGKQDQDLIQRELMCALERETITNDNEMKSMAKEPLPKVIGATFETNNAETNNIDKIPNQIEASVDKVSDKFDLDEMMMADAPIEASNNGKSVKNGKKFTSEKPLKTQPKEMRKMKDGNKDDMMMSDQPSDDVDEIFSHTNKVVSLDEPKEMLSSSTPTSVEEMQQTTIEVRSRRETEHPVKSNISVATTETNIRIESDVVQATPVELTRDHFIPPMLLVQHQNSTTTPSTAGHEITVTILNSTPESNYQENLTSSAPETQVPTNDSTTISSSFETSSTISTNFEPITSTTQDSTTVLITSHIQTPHEHPKTMMRPHAPKFGGEISYHAPNLPITTKAPVDLALGNDSNTDMEMINSTETSVNVENVTNSIVTVSSTVKSTESVTVETTQVVNETTTEVHLDVSKRSDSAVTIDKHQHKNEQHKEESHHQINNTNTNHADFTNSSPDYENYKPNRKRILTKVETHTFIQKVFG